MISNRELQLHQGQRGGQGQDILRGLSRSQRHSGSARHQARGGAARQCRRLVRGRKLRLERLESAGYSANLPQPIQPGRPLLLVRGRRRAQFHAQHHPAGPGWPRTPIARLLFKQDGQSGKNPFFTAKLNSTIISIDPIS